MADTNASQYTALVMVPPVKSKRSKYALGCTLLPDMTSSLLGNDIGVMSGAAIFIKEDAKISDTKIAVLMGILNIYSLLGSCVAGGTSDWIGRRYCHLRRCHLLRQFTYYYGLEGHGDEAAGQTVSGHGQADPLSLEPQWEDLIAVYPCDWPKSNGEGGENHQIHDDVDDDRPHRLFILVAIDDSQPKPQEGKGEHHAGHARERERESSPSLQVNRPKLSPLEFTSNQGSVKGQGPYFYLGGI